MNDNNRESNEMQTEDIAAQILDRLYELYMQRDKINNDIENEKDQLIPENLRLALIQVEEAHDEEKKKVLTEISELEDQIKEMSLEFGMTFQGNVYQAVYRRGNHLWNDEALFELARQWPGLKIMDLHSIGKDSVSVKLIPSTKKEKKK